MCAYVCAYVHMCACVRMCAYVCICVYAAMTQNLTIHKNMLSTGHRVGLG